MLGFKMKKLFLLLVLLLFSSLPVPNAMATSPKNYQVVVSFSILADWVQAIGGESINVMPLILPEQDAHGFTPTASDVVSLGTADLVIINGLGFEPWADKLTKSAQLKAPLIIASEGITPRESAKDSAHHHHHHHDTLDPHAWQDVANARIYVKNISEALQKLVPEQAADIAARSKAYDVKLQELDADIKAKLASIPADKRTVITSHDAFGYFGSAYNVKFLSPQGLSTTQEPSPKKIAALIKLIKQEQVKKVFIEKSASPKLLEQLAQDSGATVGDVVYADTLPQIYGKGQGYLLMMRHNVQAFISGMNSP